MAKQVRKRSIEKYEHADKERVNNPPVGLVTPDTDKDAGKTTYTYDPHLDPQLVWAGKTEHTAIRERTHAGLEAARARGRTGGRSPTLTDKGKSAAFALLRDPDIPVKEVARRLGISVAALYQHFPGGRGALLEAASDPNPLTI